MRLDFPCGLWGQRGWGWAGQWEFPKGSTSCAFWRRLRRLLSLGSVPQPPSVWEWSLTKHVTGLPTSLQPRPETCVSKGQS